MDMDILRAGVASTSAGNPDFDFLIFVFSTAIASWYLFIRYGVTWLDLYNRDSPRHRNAKRLFQAFLLLWALALILIVFFPAE
ncbi:hypothetical protein [Rhodovulum steppense]|uniref:Uncharacterized protein n=1 Tax=Rhodovulum steppense TaxID=540251 RepID=A0A4V2R3W8_9RHOB|nr:hypothetical protein [Rhodovulum steppense]TCM79622.1 hypothetical protein EV216_12211 [Rhodovulum steppense]